MDLKTCVQSEWCVSEQFSFLLFPHWHWRLEHTASHLKVQLSVPINSSARNCLSILCLSLLCFFEPWITLFCLTISLVGHYSLPLYFLCVLICSNQIYHTKIKTTVGPITDFAELQRISFKTFWFKPFEQTDLG